MVERFDFSAIGIEMGDPIHFRKGDTAVIAASTAPLVKYADGRDPTVYSLSIMTKRLLGYDRYQVLPDDVDYYELWLFKGRSLRSIFNGLRRDFEQR